MPLAGQIVRSRVNYSHHYNSVLPTSTYFSVGRGSGCLKLILRGSGRAGRAGVGTIADEGGVIADEGGVRTR